MNKKAEFLYSFPPHLFAEQQHKFDLFVLSPLIAQNTRAPKPGGVGGLVEFAGSESEGLSHCNFLGSSKKKTVSSKKDVGRYKPRPLISVEEGVIFDNTHRIGGGEIEEIGGLVKEEMLRTAQGGVQQAFVADTG